MRIADFKSVAVETLSRSIRPQGRQKFCGSGSMPTSLFFNYAPTLVESAQCKVHQVVFCTRHISSGAESAPGINISGEAAQEGLVFLIESTPRAGRIGGPHSQDVQQPQ